MAHQTCYGAHNCEYARFIRLFRPDDSRRCSRARSLPPRPVTRRHPEDMPVLGCSNRTSFNSSCWLSESCRSPCYYTESPKQLSCGSSVNNSPQSMSRNGMNLEEVQPRACSRNNTCYNSSCWARKSSGYTKRFDHMTPTYKMADQSMTNKDLTESRPAYQNNYTQNTTKRHHKKAEQNMPNKDIDSTEGRAGNLSNISQINTKRNSKKAEQSMSNKDINSAEGRAGNLSNISQINTKRKDTHSIESSKSLLHTPPETPPTSCSKTECVCSCCTAEKDVNPFHDMKSREQLTSSKRKAPRSAQKKTSNPTELTPGDANIDEGTKFKRCHFRIDSSGNTRCSIRNFENTDDDYRHSIVSEGRESPKYNSPVTTPPRCADSAICLRNHEYLQFLLRITEDIIKNDLYTNTEMRKVFLSHVNANKDRLKLDRMLLQIYDLMRELNMTLAGDTEEYSTPSWTELETAMRNILEMQKIKAKETAKTNRPKCKYKLDHPDRKCICFDLRNMDQCPATKRKKLEEEIEKLNNEENEFVNQYKNSLDSLIECTEPNSSQATCKNTPMTSSSTFGNVDVLPGFENLETPTVPVRNISGESQDSKSGRKCVKTECECCGKRKSKTLKRKKPIRSSKTKKTRSTRKPKKQTRNVVAQTSEPAPTSKTRLSKEVARPANAAHNSNARPTTKEGKPKPPPSLNDLENCDCPGDNILLKNSKNDYILVKENFYLLKTFLDENPNAAAMKVEGPTAINNFTTTICSPDGNAYPVQPTSSKIQQNSNDLTTSKIQQGTEIKDIFTTTSNNETDTPIEKYEPETKIDNISGEAPYSHLLASSNKYTTEASFVDYQSNQYCEIPCPNSAVCTRMNLVRFEKKRPSENENKLISNDYDLTPQKDSNPKENIEIYGMISDDYVSPKNAESILHTFLTSREIQTDVIQPTQTIVATAFIKQDESIDISNDHHAIGPSKPPMTKPFFGEASGVKNINRRSLENNRHKTHQLNSEQSTGAFVPPATFNKTNQKPVIEPEIKVISSPPLSSPKVRKEEPSDADEDGPPHRRVSILKNPIVQIPIEKIFTDNDQGKKKPAPLIKSPESFKEHQADKKFNLGKPTHGLESIRELRPSQNTASAPIFPKQPSSLKDQTKTTKPIEDNDTPKKAQTLRVIGTVFPSPAAPSNVTQKKDIIDTEPSSPEDSSEANDQNELGISSDQKKTKPNKSRRNNEDADKIASDLNKLVESLKEEQKTKEEIKIVDADVQSENQSVKSNKKSPLVCCGFLKKKKNVQPSPIIMNQPGQQSNFAELEYKRKSEAFETALASLGHKSMTKLKEEPKKSEKRKASVKPSFIEHSGNRLSFVRIQDSRGSSLDGMKSEMILANIENEIAATPASKKA